MIIICNFSTETQNMQKVIVPSKGTYKEIFNSDRSVFGGEGNINKTGKNSKKDLDENEFINIKVPQLGITIFKKK